MLRGLAVTGVLLLAAGCGAPAATPTAPTPTPTPTPQTDGGMFSTPSDIMTRAGQALPCSDASPMTPTDAKAQSVCDNGNVVIRVYEDHSGIDEQINLLSLSGGAWLLTGKNWSINAPEATLQQVQPRLGGRLIHVKCLSNC